jgi:DNA-directed RNA polymerase subunit alpha
MASNAPALDLSAFLESLTYSSDDLGVAKAAARSSRDAWRTLVEVTKTVPDTADGTDALRLATALYLLSRPEEALRVVENAGNGPQAILLKGRASLEVCDPSVAANAFASLVGSPVDGHSMLIDLATAAALSGDTAMAEKAASKLPDGADALYAEGIALESDGEYADARAKYEAALKKDPNHQQALFRLALRLDTDGNDERAVEIYQRLVALSPTHVNAVLNLALLYEDRGRLNDAEKCYRRILEADPKHVRAQIGLRDVHASQTMYFDEDHERREDRRAAVLRTPISEFELSVRSRNCLAKMNIDTLADLVRKTETELLAYKNFGETSLQEIKDILAQKGLRLGMTSEDDSPLYTASRAEAEAQLDALFGTVSEDAQPRGELGFVGDMPAAAAPPPDPRSVAIATLDLSIRARRCMERLGIATVGDLLERTEAELLAAKNFGQTSLNEIRRKLEPMGLTLKKK